MVLVSYSGKEINAKIVYYGPGLSGKTTNLESIFGSIPEGHKGRMVSVKTKTERTLFFDFLPVNLGELSGFKTRFLLYTVPGQVYYNATRKLVLKGVDAVVFVADSQKDKMDENLESLQNLRDNLRDQGMKLEDIPWVLQYNKRDLPNILPISELDAKINPENVPSYTAVATTGEGVLDTFKAVSRLLLKHLSSEIGVKVVQPAAEMDAAIGAQLQGAQEPSAEATSSPQSAPASAGEPSPQPAPPPAPEPSPAPSPPTGPPKPESPAEPVTEPVGMATPEMTPIPARVPPELKAQAHEYVTPLPTEIPPELKAEIESQKAPPAEAPQETQAQAQEPVTPVPAPPPQEVKAQAQEPVTPVPAPPPQEIKAEAQEPVTPFPAEAPQEVKAQAQEPVTPSPAEAPEETKAETKPKSVAQDLEPVQVKTIYPQPTPPPEIERKPAEETKPEPGEEMKHEPIFDEQEQTTPTFAQRLMRWFGRMEGKTDQEPEKVFGVPDSPKKPLAERALPVAPPETVTPPSQPEETGHVESEEAGTPQPETLAVSGPETQPVAEIQPSPETQPVAEAEPETAPTVEEEPQAETEPAASKETQPAATGEISQVVPLPPMDAHGVTHDAEKPEQEELVIPVLLPKRNMHRQLVLKICIRFAEDEEISAPKADIDGADGRAVNSA
jgi:signal recognition particle receptor subunit beta